MLKDLTVLEPVLMPGPLAVDAEDLAKMLGVSMRHIRRMDAEGRLPRAVNLGRRKLWAVDVIRAWLLADCPDRAPWEREGGMKHGR